jgi:predicted phosphodiesterase
MMKKLVVLSGLVLVLAVMSGQAIAATVIYDDFTVDTIASGDWVQVYTNQSWGITTPNYMWGYDSEARRMSGHTIAVGEVATLISTSDRPSCSYIHKLVTYDGTNYTTIANWIGSHGSSTPVSIFNAFDLSAYAGQELGMTTGFGTSWGQITNVQLDVYIPENAEPLDIPPPYDLAGPDGIPDCIVDLYDFASLASTFDVYDPTELSYLAKNWLSSTQPLPGYTLVTPALTFGFCSDVHRNFVADANQRLAAFVNEANRQNCDFIVQLGDFCFPESASDSFMAVWDTFNGPGYHVIGNHDPEGYTRDQVRAYWSMPANYYSFDVKGWHFVVLDGNDVKSPPQSGYPYWIGETQQNWLISDLASTTNPTIIFSHQPLSNDDSKVENATVIRGILEQANASSRKVVACFAGHHHYDDHEIINDIHYVQSNSMSYQWVDPVGPYHWNGPLFGIVGIFDDGTISIRGRKTTWIGNTPWEDGYPYPIEDQVDPATSTRQMR